MNKTNRIIVCKICDEEIKITDDQLKFKKNEIKKLHRMSEKHKKKVNTKEYKGNPYFIFQKN